MHETGDKNTQGMQESLIGRKTWQ